jgi:hypothetical protein
VAEASGGGLLTVTMISRGSWAPTVIGAGRQHPLARPACQTCLEARRHAEGRAHRDRDRAERVSVAG